MKLRVLIALALLALGTLSHCKKGEDDPAFSFLSRKTRVAGTWTLKEGTSFSSTIGQEQSRSENIVYTEGAYTATLTESFDGQTQTQVYSDDHRFSMTFEKDGLFSMEDNGSTYEGTWNFTGGVGERKNKEQIVVNLDTENHPFSFKVFEGNEAHYTFDIRELRNKKMVLVLERKATQPTGWAEELKLEFVLESKG